MEVINTVIGVPLGYMMWLCYTLVKNYGLAIILFTILTKVIMFPISIMVQKNSIKMVKLKPRLDALRYQYIGDSDGLLDAQTALYKEEKYSPMAGVFPLLLQLPIIFGLIDVIYKPLRHLLHLPSEVIDAFVMKTAQVLNATELGSSPQLKVVEAINMPQFLSEFESLQSVLPDYDVHSLIQTIQRMDLSFMGINLASTPSVFQLDFLFLVPVLAGISAYLLCFAQNKENVLQIEQNKLSQWAMTIFMIAFSVYFAFLVPAGVGFYWILGNVFAIFQLYLLNYMYSPKDYIDYAALEKMKLKALEEGVARKRNKAREKADYKRFFAKGNAENMELMFYSEQSGFYKYFANIIDGILEMSDLDIHYVTSDPEDAVFKIGNPRIKTYYIGETKLITLMMKIEADVVVMTMPDLEKYHIKRSKVRKDVEYIYTDHACSSLNLTYRTGAFDHFDTIFAVSPAQAEEIRAMEIQRNTKKKNIVECGYGLIDNMIAAYEASEKCINEKKTVLIAPSWQEDNILDSCLDELIERLHSTEYKIIVRPHPQYIRRFPANMDRILDSYKERIGEDFIIETDFSSNVTVYTADLLITDWSAIAFEYCFTTNKPVLFVDTAIKIVNTEYEKISIIPFDITARNEVGRSVDPRVLNDVAEVAEDLIENQEQYSQKINSLKNDYFYNLGKSGEVAAGYIISQIDKQKIDPEHNKS